MSREEPAIDLDRALNYAVARVELSGRPSSNEPIFVISAENPRLELASPLNVGFDALRVQAQADGFMVGEALGSDFDNNEIAERSVALTGAPEWKAKRLAKDFGQEALFRLTSESQDVLFVKGGEICVLRDDLLKRRNLMRETFSDFLWRTLQRRIECPSELRGIRRWHLVGDPLVYKSIPEPSSDQLVVRALNDGTTTFRPMVALIGMKTGRVQAMEVADEAVEDGSPYSVIGSRIHLDKCEFADVLRGQVKNRYRIYVWRSHKPYPKAPDGATSIYVGVTGRTVEERINQHRVLNVKSRTWVRDYDGELNEALMPDVCLPSWQTATAFEEWWANLLRYKGYYAKGGH
jgi:hypothetical protein